MDIEVRRTDKNGRRTMGSMYINDKWVGYTLEDPVRPVKVYGDTAIPAGTYNVVVNYSPHFGRDMPELENVPNFDGIRIHSGNTTKDTKGCILVGLNRTEDSLTDSRLATDNVQIQIERALAKGEKVTLRITG